MLYIYNKDTFKSSAIIYHINFIKYYISIILELMKNNIYIY